MKIREIVSQILNLHRLLAIALATVAILIGQFAGAITVAQAGPLTPEANSYNTPQPDAHAKYNRSLDNLTPRTGIQTSDRDDLVRNSRRNLKSTADNVREKLNLDEPLPKSTKEFMGQTKDALKGTTKSITRQTSGGYYSRRDRIRNAY